MIDWNGNDSKTVEEKMKKILIVLLTALFALNTSLAYAQVGVQAGTVPTVMLVTGDEPVEFENDVGITAYTETFYANGNPIDKRVFGIEEYEKTEFSEFRIKRMTICVYEFEEPNEWIFKEYRVVENRVFDDHGRVVESVITIYDEAYAEDMENAISRTVTTITEHNTYQSYVRPFSWFNRWAIPYERSPLPEHAQIVLAIFPGYLSSTGSVETRISDVTVSDLVTGEVMGFIPDLTTGQDNTVVLEKLDQIQTDLGMLNEINDTITNIKRYLKRIYHYVWRIYFRLVHRPPYWRR